VSKRRLVRQNDAWCVKTTRGASFSRVVLTHAPFSRVVLTHAWFSRVVLTPGTGRNSQKIPEMEFPWSPFLRVDMRFPIAPVQLGATTHPYEELIVPLIVLIQKSIIRRTTTIRAT
jgi:hypothetical protein